MIEIETDPYAPLETDEELDAYVEETVNELMEKVEEEDKNSYAYIDYYVVNNPRYSYNTYECNNVTYVPTWGLSELRQHITELIREEVEGFKSNSHRHLYRISQILQPAWVECEVVSVKDDDTFCPEPSETTEVLRLVLRTRNLRG